MNAKSIDLVLLELMETPSKERWKSSDSSTNYWLKDKNRALEISLGKYPDGNFCVLVYSRGDLVYIARREKNLVTEERHEKGDWEEKVRNLARQQTFSFFTNGGPR